AHPRQAFQSSPLPPCPPVRARRRPGARGGLAPGLQRHRTAPRPECGRARRDGGRNDPDGADPGMGERPGETV
ncbi:MAG: hypothetical protein AVDCRST_MAG68-4104, partial [uncultured Gemmatimonadetes bacterium]